MADKPEDQPEVRADAGDEAAAAAGDTDGAAADATGQAETSASPQALLDAAEEQIATLKDQALRAQADAENARRRAACDVENAHKFALEKFVSELLPVLDSMEKAVETAGAGVSDHSEAAVAIAEGVQLSLKLFVDVLGKVGISQLDPMGEPFDPQHHEAMAMVPNPDLEPNSVMEVMQKGYTLNGRLVRAAMVVVSKAPE
jgi:molecular chaperone GrpE